MPYASEKCGSNDVILHSYFRFEQGDEMIAARCVVLAVIALGTVSGAESPNERLILAARQGKLSAVRGLIERGAELNAQSANGNTALIEAVHAGHADVVQWLLSKGADVNRKTHAGYQSYRAASTIIGTGVLFQTDTLQYFLDHAVQANVVSPVLR